MTAIGRIESFDEKQEKWETYFEPVEDFFFANNINNDHQCQLCWAWWAAKRKNCWEVFWHKANQPPVGRGNWVVYLDAYPTASIHGHFVLSPVLLATRYQDGGPSNLTTKSTIPDNRGLWTLQSTEEKLWDNDDIQHPAGLANSYRLHNIKYK